MTNLSKISRSIIVVFFIAVMIFLGYQNVLLCVKNIDNTLPIGFIQISNIFKVLYAAIIIILVIMYVYLKEKLYKIKLKRSLSLFYRYIYLFVIGGVTSFLTLFQINSRLNGLDYTFLIIFSVFTGIVIKKIIFNVSKSDILSVIGMLLYTSIIDIIIEKEALYVSAFICILTVIAIYIMQIIIDELKQKGIKNKKYLLYATILGIVVGISIICGINWLVYVALSIIIFLVGSNLDNAHITFPRRAMEDISKEKREFLFKIERINISKLLICVIIILAIAGVIVFSFSIFVKNTDISNTQNLIISNIINTFNQNSSMNFNFELSNMLTYFKELLLMSKVYYMVLIVYILFMEILAFVLNRRYDTKSTVMKLLFMLIFASIIIFNLNLTIYQPIITVMLIMISIVNTSNIYLNREERIKLLVA